MPDDPTTSDQAARNLMLAVIESSSTPLLLLDGELAVIAGSTSFCIAFQVDAGDLPGRSIFELGSGEWNVPRLRSLLNATLGGAAMVERYEMDLKSGGRGLRHLVLNARKLDYGEAQEARIMLAILDVTEALASKRLTEALLHEKTMLLQEVQHRVANSLQIIASVLMISARKVQSEETRSHLHDAHHRVMAIAALQQQLTISTLTHVELGMYFARLCESLSASMIRDAKKIELTVTVDESIVEADISISLGLIVTELVIKALKHAFPDDRSGKIAVSYWSRGNTWTLSVIDNGIGMPEKAEGIRQGLGTSIVSALATKLEAVVHTTSMQPGTSVAIIRR